MYMIEFFLVAVNLNTQVPYNNIYIFKVISV